MAFFVARAALRVFVAIPAWAETLRPMLRDGASPISLPVFSNIAVATNDRSAADGRRRFAPDGVPLLGHFGTYGAMVSDVLAQLLPKLLESRQDSRLLLLGRNGEAFRNRIGSRRPDLISRIYAPGPQNAEELSRLLSLCDVMVQPYPDGINGRQTSAMAALAHGLSVVTTSGRLTEPFWRDSQAVALAPVGGLDRMSDLACALLANERERRNVAVAGRELYARRFDLQHTIAALRAQSFIASGEPRV
jgi:glycosyltransferase involved in cell wall biosynthesis